MKKISTAFYLIISVTCLLLSACGTRQQPAETPQQTTIQETAAENVTEKNIQKDDTTEIHVPSKEKVLDMRETVLKGMSKEDTERLTENIKIANLRLESAYLNDNIFDKLSDKDSLYWNYFDQKGDIQIGEKNGMPVMEYNRFDAANFINLIQDMQKSVHNEMLAADLQRLIDLTSLAAETHEMEYANEIYKILHDLDYFLLRYGIEDVGKYTQDGGVVSKYYGVLIVYGAAPDTATEIKKSSS